MQQLTRVTLNGQVYMFNGKNWLGSDYMIPPSSLIPELDRLAEDQFVYEDSQINGFQELMDIAISLRDAGQFVRALKASRKAMEIQPDDAAPASVCCSILRMMRRSEEALAIADNFLESGSRYRPLLTSRAAALADLDRYDEALRQIRQVIAIGRGKGGEEAMAVWSRIKAEAPELFLK